jgi:hypothetical protein
MKLICNLGFILVSNSTVFNRLHYYYRRSVKVYLIKFGRHLKPFIKICASFNLFNFHFGITYSFVRLSGALLLWPLYAMIAIKATSSAESVSTNVWKSGWSDCNTVKVIKCTNNNITWMAAHVFTVRWHKLTIVTLTEVIHRLWSFIISEYSSSTRTSSSSMYSGSKY